MWLPCKVVKLNKLLKVMLDISNEHLRELENEAIFVMREVAAQFENKVLLFSGGKDSIVLVHLARKAFWPAKIPFILMHIDTGHNFEETLTFRDDLAKEFGADLIVKYVQDSIDQGRVKEECGINASRNKAQTVTLLDAIEELRIDVAIGGGRRDEEKARAKERFFSHRNEFGQWDPKNQRPELWNIFNGKKHQGEHFRVFPISNWTELDVWQYILTENIKLPDLYYTHKRKIFSRNGTLLAWAPFMQLRPSEEVFEADVRCRTIGDITCTGVTLSRAQSLEEIIAEIAATRTTERGGRYDDKRSEAAMEDRKKEGYF
jgi:sulfate adenylyltransferase subunit 2